jgi:hypothetical protein
MLDAARNAAAFTEAVAGLANAINAPIKGLANVMTAFVKATDPLVDLIIAGDPSGFMTKKPPSSSSAPAAGFGGKTFYADAQKNADAIAKAETTAKKRAAELLAIKKKQQALEGKILKDKRLQLAIDKANTALGKGEDIFDMDKIQIAAALTNQAEQLGKATSSAQVLQIANDTARLNVKQSILALEDAIASKDEAAIIAATKKLNEDLKILGVLSGQNVKLQDIKSILDSLKPKDLINISNLEEALRLLGQINLASTGSKTTPAPNVLGKSAIQGMTPAQAEAILAKEPTSVATNLTPSQISGNRYTAQAEAAYEKMLNSIDLGGIAASSFSHGINSGLGVAASLSGARYAAQGQAAMGSGYVININTGIGDPNAIAEAIDQVLTDAATRGTLRGYTIA